MKRRAWSMPWSKDINWLLAGVLFLTLSTANFPFGMSTFFEPLTREFGWSRAALSGAFSAVWAVAAVMGPLHGYLVDRFGPRLMLLGGAAFLGLGYLLISRMQSLEAFYVIVILCQAPGYLMASMLTLSPSVIQRFRRNTARGLTAIVTGSHLGNVIGPPIIAWLITAQGWRMAAVWIGAVGWALMTILGWGLWGPSGRNPSQPVAATDQGITASVSEPTPNLLVAARHAWRSRDFWVLSISHSLSVVVVAAVLVHLIPAFVDFNFTLEQAGQLMGAVSATTLAAILGVGWIGDRFDKARVISIAIVIQSVALYLLAWAPTAGVVIGAALLYGLGAGVRIPLYMALRGERFSPKALATLTGYLMVFVGFASVIGPLLAGIIYDLSGNYSGAFGLLATLNLLGALILFYPGLHPDAPKWA